MVGLVRDVCVGEAVLEQRHMSTTNNATLMLLTYSIQQSPPYPLGY